jgi:ketosteroid isomerase-like protein
VKDWIPGSDCGDPGMAGADHRLFLFSSESVKIKRRENARGGVMTRAEVEQLVRELYAARVAGNVDEIVRLMAPDIDFALAGDPAASPVVGRLRGSDLLHAQLTKLVQGFRFNSYDIVTLVVEGSNAAVRGRASITSTATGTTVDMELADFIEVRDGRAASFVQFCDTALAAKLATTS